MAIRPKEIVTVKKTLTCTGNGDTLLSIFALTGIVRVHEIYGVVTEATNATTLQKVGLVLYEATPTTVEITDVGTGVDGSATVVGSLFIRTAVSGSDQPLTHKKASVCSSVETMYEGGGYGLVLVQRAGVTTNIKVEFTGDANTDVDIQWFVKYTPLSDGSSITAV
jgi:hypothetical protein